MNQVYKTAGGVLLAIVFYLILDKNEKDMAVLLSVLVCVLVASVAASFLMPVLAFIKEIQQLTELDSKMLDIVLKTVGIGLLCEIVSLVCADAGNSSMAKAVQMMGTGVILWLSLPLLSAMMNLVKEILGEI